MKSSPPIVAGDPRQLEIIALCNIMRDMTAQWVARQPDPIHAKLMLATAASTFAGINVGELIAAGVPLGPQKARMTADAMSNFREGIGIGEEFGKRILAQTAEGGQ